MFREFREVHEAQEVRLEDSPLLQTLMRQNEMARRETDEAMMQMQFETERVITRQDRELLDAVKKSAKLLKRNNF